MNDLGLLYIPLCDVFSILQCFYAYGGISMCRMRSPGEKLQDEISSDENWPFIPGTSNNHSAITGR